MRPLRVPRSRFLVLLLVVAATACAGDDAAPDHPEYAFGPFEVKPGEDLTNICVQITLDNPEPLYVSQVELSGAPGFHHSNWFFVPTSAFPGDDGVYPCDDRKYDETTAALLGGVLFAQSTQASDETQAFPAGAAVVVPPYSKLVAGIHLINAGDVTLAPRPTLALTTMAEAEVTTKLALMEFENRQLGLPAHARSRFTAECDLGPKHQAAFGRAPDFHFYYALGHYHTKGQQVTVEVADEAGNTMPIFQTAAHAGDSLGGMIDPPRSIEGFSRVRFTCEYVNDGDVVLRSGGKEEMCVFLAFTDSENHWGGGTPVAEPGAPADDDGVASFVAPLEQCEIITAPAH